MGNVIQLAFHAEYVTQPFAIQKSFLNKLIIAGAKKILLSNVIWVNIVQTAIMLQTLIIKVDKYVDLAQLS